MIQRVGMHEAKTHFSRLVERAGRGEEIVVQRNGKPVAKLIGYKEKLPVTESFGIWSGEGEIPTDFDEWPEDIARALGMFDE